jgi:anti-sigma B factor antagonist
MVSAPRLRNVVTDQVRQGYVKVVVDMTEVDFIDSSGLGALIGCLKTAREHGGDLRISGVGKQVATVLRISNIDRILSPRADAESAFDE